MLFLTVLKTIGLILLIILGIVLLLILAVLFVPVRYQLEGVKNTAEQKLEGKAVISWLLHILHISAEYNGELNYCARVFGIPVLRSGGKDKKEKPPRKKKVSRKKKRPAKKKTKKDREEQEQSRQREKTSVTEEKTGDPAETEENESVKYEEMEFRIETYEDVEAESRAEEESEQAEKAGEPEADAKTVDEEEQEPEPSFIEKLGEFLGKLWEFIKKRKEKLEALWNRLKQAGRRLDFYIEFLTNEKNQEQLRNIGRETGKLFKHIRPKKFRCHLVFGTEEPDTTGSILAVLAVIYPFFSGGLTVEPRFQESILDFKLFTKGRVRVFTVLCILFRIYFHKGFRKMLKEYRNREV